MKKYLSFNDLHGQIHLETTPMQILEMARLGEIPPYFALPITAINRAYDIRGVNDQNYDHFIDNMSEYEVLSRLLPEESYDGFVRLTWDSLETLLIKGSVDISMGLAGESNINMYRVHFDSVTVGLRDLFIASSDVLKAWKAKHPSRATKNRDTGPKRVNARDRVIGLFVDSFFKANTKLPGLNDLTRHFSAISEINNGGSEIIYEMTEDKLYWTMDNGKMEPTKRSTLNKRLTEIKSEYRKSHPSIF